MKPYFNFLQQVQEDILKNKKKFIASQQTNKEQIKENITALKDFLDKPYFYEIWQLQKYEEYFVIFQQLAKQFIELFENTKKNEGLMSIHDLELTTLNILRTKPHVAKTFSQQWDYWLIDEYQDTTPLQVEILDGLRGTSKEFVVGDPQQSIYLF